MRATMDTIQKAVTKLSKADDFELYISYTDDHNTRFGQNAISQHCTGINMEITYIAVFNNQIGSCTLNDISEEALVKMVETAENIARFNMSDPDYVPSLDKRNFKNINNVSQATLDLSPAQIVEIIKTSIEASNKKGAILSGNFNKGYSLNRLITKNGFEGEYEFTYYSYSMTMKKGPKETKVEIGDKDFSHFNQSEFMDKLVNQFDSLENPIDMNPEKIAVILRPQAVSNYFMYLYWVFNRKMADEGITPFTDQIGKGYFGEKFSMHTSAEDTDLVVFPYNSDGITETVQWVKNGVLQALPCNRSWAKKINITPLIMTNLVIEGGETSEEEMMRSVGRGLIINNFWYIRVNDMKSADFTGMTRDGVLYFEDGKIKNSVNNFRFNETLENVTKNILSLGISELVNINNKVPTMLIKDFNFVDKTSF